MVLTAHFRWMYCLPPKSLEMMTAQPAQLPMAIAIKIMVMG